MVKPTTRNNNTNSNTTTNSTTTATTSTIKSIPTFFESLSLFSHHLLFSYSHLPYLLSLLLVSDALLSFLIIHIVPYTEIDWLAYVSECKGYLDGIYDYSKLKGETGPLVYPAGFVYVYSIIMKVTNSEIYNVQVLFVGLYILTIGVNMMIYYKLLENTKIPNYIIILLCISKRIHSIYMLRLFNDGIATLFISLAILCLLHKKYLISCIIMSLGVSIKMNILLYSPAWLFILLRSVSLEYTIFLLFICAAIQVLLGLPFLLTYPYEYIKGSFDFGRVFTYKWTVNWRFINEETFISKEFALILLCLHIFMMVIYLNSTFSNGMLTFLFSKVFGKKALHYELSADFIVTTLFIVNFIGVACARSLHYQFYSWYYFSIPWLLWKINIPTIFRFLLLSCIEVCWNVYPSTNCSSALLNICHVTILIGLAFNKESRPTENFLITKSVKSN